MKTILVIGYMHTKEDKRVYRTVKALSNCSKVVYQYLTELPEKVYEEGNIIYLPIEWKEDATSLIKLFKERRRLDSKILNLIERQDFDILYMHHFLPTMPILPFKIAKQRGKKVIFDIHEYHPQNFLAELKKPIRQLKEKIMWKILKIQFDFCDRLVFVSKEAKDDISQITGICKESIVVPNYAAMKLTPIQKDKEIVFVGKTERPIKQEIKVIKQLLQKGFSFKVIGINNNNIFENIQHSSTGFLPYEKMVNELSKATFSLVSFSTIEDRNYKNDIYSLPHKFFDSLAAGTPVIVRESFVSMRKIVEDFKVGVLINPENIDQSVQDILKAYENYSELLKSVKNHSDEFVWSKQKEKEFIEFVLG